MTIRTPRRPALLLAALALPLTLPLATPASADHHAAGHKAAAQTIVQAAAASADHTTLVAAIKAAGLADALSGEGPFTVFAPTNAAFARLPAGTVETLLKPENKAQLTRILSYHVVPGKITAASAVAAIKAGGGRTMLTNLAGARLIASLEDGKVVLTDKKGGKATVIAADVAGSNGVIHVTDAVSLPG